MSGTYGGHSRVPPPPPQRVFFSPPVGGVHGPEVMDPGEMQRIHQEFSQYGLALPPPQVRYFGYSNSLCGSGPELQYPIHERGLPNVRFPSHPPSASAPAILGLPPPPPFGVVAMPGPVPWRPTQGDVIFPGAPQLAPSSCPAVPFRPDRRRRPRGGAEHGGRQGLRSVYSPPSESKATSSAGKVSSLTITPPVFADEPPAISSLSGSPSIEPAAPRGDMILSSEPAGVASSLPSLEESQDAAVPAELIGRKRACRPESSVEEGELPEEAYSETTDDPGGSTQRALLPYESKNHSLTREVWDRQAEEDEIPNGEFWSGKAFVRAASLALQSDGGISPQGSLSRANSNDTPPSGMIVFKFKDLDLSFGSVVLKELVDQFLPFYRRSLSVSLDTMMMAEVYLMGAQLDPSSLKLILNSLESLRIYPVAIHLGNNPSLGHEGITGLAEFISTSPLPFRWMSLNNTNATGAALRTLFHAVLQRRDLYPRVVAGASVPLWIDLSGSDLGFDPDRDVFDWLERYARGLYCRALTRYQCGINRCAHPGVVFHLPKLSDRPSADSQSRRNSGAAMQLVEGTSSLMNATAEELSAVVARLPSFVEPLLVQALTDGLAATPSALASGLDGPASDRPAAGGAPVADEEEHLSCVSSDPSEEQQRMDDITAGLEELSSIDSEEEEEETLIERTSTQAGSPRILLPNSPSMHFALPSDPSSYNRPLPASFPVVLPPPKAQLKSQRGFFLQDLPGSLPPPPHHGIHFVPQDATPRQHQGPVSLPPPLTSQAPLPPQPTPAPLEEIDSPNFQARQQALADIPPDILGPLLSDIPVDTSPSASTIASATLMAAYRQLLYDAYLSLGRIAVDRLIFPAEFLKDLANLYVSGEEPTALPHLWSEVTPKEAATFLLSQPANTKTRAKFGLNFEGQTLSEVTEDIEAAPRASGAEATPPSSLRQQTRPVPELSLGESPCGTGGQPTAEVTRQAVEEEIEEGQVVLLRSGDRAVEDRPSPTKKRRFEEHPAVNAPAGVVPGESLLSGAYNRGPSTARPEKENHEELLLDGGEVGTTQVVGGEQSPNLDTQGNYSGLEEVVDGVAGLRRGNRSQRLSDPEGKKAMLGNSRTKQSGVPRRLPAHDANRSRKRRRRSDSPDVVCTTVAGVPDGGDQHGRDLVNSEDDSLEELDVDDVQFMDAAMTPCPLPLRRTSLVDRRAGLPVGIVAPHGSATKFAALSEEVSGGGAEDCGAEDGEIA